MHYSHLFKGRETKDTMEEHVKGFIAEAGGRWQRSEGNTKLPMIRIEYSNANIDEKQNVDPKTGAPQNEYGKPSTPAQGKN